MVLDIISRGQFPAPRVVDDNNRANLYSLNNRLHLSPVFRSLPFSLGQQELDRAVIVIVATLKKGIGIEEGRKPILRPPAFKQIFADSIWNENRREQKSEAGYQFQMVERYNARTVNRTAPLPHWPRIQSRGAVARIIKPKVSVPKANRAVLALC